MTNNLSINYELKLPSGTRNVENSIPSREYNYPVPTGISQDEYYKALHKQAMKAKSQIGADLTKWRNAVGNLEDKKVPKKRTKESDEEENETGE